MSKKARRRLKDHTRGLNRHSKGASQLDKEVRLRQEHALNKITKPTDQKPI